MRRSHSLLLFLLLLVISLLAIAEMGSKSIGLKSILQSDSIPAELLCYNKLGELFKQLDVVQFFPADTDNTPEISNYVTDTAFSKRRQISNSRIVATGSQNNKLQLISKIIPENAFVEDELIISVATAPENLIGSNGIISNYKRRGKKWEKFSFVTIYSGTELLFESAAGLRLHGGNSRLPDWEHHSFRLYFRKKYGESFLSPEDIFPSTVPVKTLVVHVSHPESWPLNNIIANDIYRRTGSTTMDYRPAKFYLNGVLQGVYWVSEHLSEKYFQKTFPDTPVTIFRYRSTHSRDTHEYKTAIKELAETSNVPLTKEHVSQVVNIEELTNFYLAVAYCGTTDWDQGISYKFHHDNSLWNWIVWDVDHSFINWYKVENQLHVSPPWQQKGFALFLDKQNTAIRNILFLRLITEDKSYREIFIKRFVEITNHILTKSKMIELTRSYDIRAKNLGLQGVNNNLQTFFQKRPDYLRYELHEYLHVPEWFELRINNPDHIPLIVDGYPKQRDYTGHYPTNMVVHIQPVEGKEPYYWVVNGEKKEKDQLKFTIEENTTITPVFNTH